MATSPAPLAPARREFSRALGLLWLMLALCLGAALYSPKARAVSQTVVISQYQTSRPDHRNDEFIEIHNMGKTPYNLNDHVLVIRYPGVVGDKELYHWMADVFIPAGGYALIGYIDYAGVRNPNWTYSEYTMEDAGGGIAIRQSPGGTILDSLGYGTYSGIFVEGAAISDVYEKPSAERLNSGCTDTDNNEKDFRTPSTSQPRNLSSPVYLCNPTVVILASNRAAPAPGAVRLEWQTAGELSLVGFNVLRRDRPGDPETLLNPDLIPARTPGDPAGANIYEYLDVAALPGRLYHYRLEILTSEGSSLSPEMAASAWYALFLPAVSR